MKAAGSILYLLLRAVLELLMLPVHLIVFLVRREEIRREIRQALEQDR